MRPPARGSKVIAEGSPLIVCERGHQVAQRWVQTSKACAGATPTSNSTTRGSALIGVLSDDAKAGRRLPPALGEVVADRLDALGPQRVDVARPVGLVADEARLLEQPQVPRDRGPADRQRVGDLLHRPRAGAEDL